MCRVGAGRQDAGAGGERWVGREAPISALQQDLCSQTPEEVVDENGASEERLGVVDESHLLQGEAQHVGTLLQNRCNLKDSIPLALPGSISSKRETENSTYLHSTALIVSILSRIIKLQRINDCLSVSAPILTVWQYVLKLKGASSSSSTNFLLKYAILDIEI